MSLLFDLGTPSQKITLDVMPAETQVCNCSGVTEGACVAAGKRSPQSVMDAPRAGKGCGSCKGLVNEIVAWFCGGEAEDDPAVHYYVPCIPLRKPELIAVIRERRLTSVSVVFGALTGGVEDAASKPALAPLLATLWNAEYDDERDVRFINDRVHANIQKDGTFSVLPEMPGGVCTPDELEPIGIARLRAVVVEDSEDIAAALDAAMQASVDGAYDPWRESIAPKTANQFAALIPASEI
jgi:nitrite reductase (NADH) large subunit